MLALVMVWTYFNLSQYLIIYSGNLPEETPWYLARISGGWQYVGLLLIFFHFAFPFIILLSRDIKRNAKWLSTIAVFILVMRLIDMFYHIGPRPFHGDTGHGMSISYQLDGYCRADCGRRNLVGIFLGELKKRPLLPHQDPFFDNAIKHGQGH